MILYGCNIVEICKSVERLPKDKRNIICSNDIYDVAFELIINVFLENSNRPAMKLFLNITFVKEKKIIVEKIIVMFWNDDFIEDDKAVLKLVE